MKKAGASNWTWKPDRFAEGVPKTVYAPTPAEAKYFPEKAQINSWG